MIDPFLAHCGQLITLSIIAHHLVTPIINHFVTHRVFFFASSELLSLYLAL